MRIAAIALFSILLLSFSDDKSKATVEQQEGVYIFILSKPVAEYEYLGTVVVKATWSGEATEIIDKMIKKTKKDYPNAQGIIFTDTGLGKADVIRFKP